MDSNWDPWSIDEAAERLDPSGADWWIAGGRAIDLFLGWETRPHADIDIEMFRKDRVALFELFEDWDLYSTGGGTWHQWLDPNALPDEAFGVWIRPDAQSPWKAEVMFADGGRDGWRYRRDNSITMPFDRLVRQTPSGLRYCTPEVQLLYKAKKHRAKDDADIARCLHRLNADQKQWLRDSLSTTLHEHPWIALLEASLSGQHE